MGTPSRILAILALFTDERPSWPAEDVASAIGTSTSTAYRYIKELCAAGFLDPVGRGDFALGPAFIQYDFLMRRRDELIQHAAPRMRELIDSTDPRLDVVLSRLFNNCVLCIHQENGPGPHPPTSYARGVAMPLFVGATSKAILAHLPDRTLKRLYLEHEEHIREHAPGHNWRTFKQDLNSIRKKRYSYTVSEVSQGRAGLAAPIFRDGAVIASVSIVLEVDVFEELEGKMDIFEAVAACAHDIEDSIMSDREHD